MRQMNALQLTMIVATAVGNGAAFTTPVSAQVPKPASDLFIIAQPADQWLARVFIGAKVNNNNGEAIGDVNDLLFDKTGRISIVVLGIGGFLGLGEKNVAVPFSALSFATSPTGQRIILVPLSMDALKQAPQFTATEKTTLDIVEDKAVEIGKKTSEKAVQLKDQALKKIDDMKKDESKKP
jgi:sporulation protein YlmC with PRC-barrel domain